MLPPGLKRVWSSLMAPPRIQSGYKLSGNGREWGEIAFGEFLETKAVIHSEAA